MSLSQGKLYFGTDGIRGEVGKFITPSMILQLGWAIGLTLSKDGKNKVIIGKDTRISGYMLESALEAGLAAAGMDTLLLGPMPTPAIAYLTRTLRAAAGIVISASHNPYYDNGIKIFSSDGFKLPDQEELQIEQLMQQDISSVKSSQLGRAERLADAPGRYIEFCKRFFPVNYNLKGMKIVLDCAHGATYHIAPNVFFELGADMVTISANPNGFNINDGCGATDCKSLVEKVLQEKADIGIAFDGDGDRVIMVDHMGNIIDGDMILYLLAKTRSNMSHKPEGVVGTLMSNIGLQKSLSSLDIDFCRSKVGDRYVLEKLLEKNWFLGGESSGHIIDLECTTTGDGIISSLLVLAGMCHSDCSLADLMADFQLYPQLLFNVPVVSGREIADDEKLQKHIQLAQKKVGPSGQVLIRPSGTEPVIRVMVQGENESIVQEVAHELVELIQHTQVVSMP